MSFGGYKNTYPPVSSVLCCVCCIPHMVCNVLVAGGRRSGAEQQAMCPE